MLMAQNISFYRIMTAGYLSAETVNAIKPKENLKDLSYIDCFDYEDSVACELKELFENDILREKLYCIEKVDEEISAGILDAISIVTNTLEGKSEEIKAIVKKIGANKFMADYVLCSKPTLRNLYFVDDNNFEIIHEFSEEVYDKLIGYYRSLSLKNTDSIEKSGANEDTNTTSEPFGAYSALSGEGFHEKDLFVIDDDALSSENLDCKKYILFLYSLNSEEFDKYIKFFIQLTKGVSIRMINGVKALGLRNFYVNYLFADELKFYQIRNFGRKSIFDLNKIKQYLVDYVISQYDLSHSDNIEKILSEEEKQKIFMSQSLKDRIGESQYNLLYSKLHELTSTASVRAKNGINNYAGDFIEDFVDKKENLLNLRNVGRKTIIEIQEIIDQIQAVLSSFEEREYTQEEMFMIEKSNYYGPLLDDYAKEFYLKNKRFPMLHIVGNSLESLNSNRLFAILNEVTPLFKNIEGNTLEYVANKHSLSKERVRQICNKEISKLNSLETSTNESGSYYATLSIADDWAYLLEELQTKKIWDLEELECFLKQENTNINLPTLCMVLSNVFSESFTIIGRKPISVSTRPTIWRNTYLVDRNLADAFDFNDMLNTLDDLICNSTETTIKTAQELVLDTFYLSWINYDYSLVDDLTFVITHILIQEQGLIPDIDYNFTIEGKKEENPGDVLYRLLFNNGEPLDLDSLYVLFKQEYPNKYKGPNSLKSIINKDPRICLVGVNNLVTLIEWEHIQIGSIRDLIVSFLQSHEEPQHIKKIVEYILPQRDTTEHSIRSTMASGDQFQQFAGAYYGLSDKQYPEWYYLSESERNSRQIIVNFETFLKANNHFPFNSSNDKNEKNLYHWWRRVTRKNSNSNYLNKEIERISASYNLLPKTRTDYTWFKNCHAYSDCIKKNGRKPRIGVTGEDEMAKWFEKAFNDITLGKLSRERETVFIELSKLI